jgi:glycosyltransferase involved in cell wall biosynthesis
MRVLHWYPKYLGGGAVAGAVRGLAVAQRAAGAEVAIAARRLGGASLYGERSGDGPRVLLWSPLRPVLARATALGVVAEDRGSLRAFAPDVVHIHGEMNPDNFVAARVFRAPLVLSPHGGFNPRVLQRGRRRAKAAYLGLARRFLYRDATVHALSPLEAADIQRMLPDRPIYCAPQGPGSAAEVEAPREARTASGTDRLLFVGRLNVAEKGLDLLLNAFALARARARRPLVLTLVGPDWGGGLATLEARCIELGIAGSVVFAGCRTGGEVARLYAGHDLYVQLSRNEGFGMSVAEALLAGLPAVLSSCIGAAAWPEVTAHGHVLVVPPEAQAAAEAILASLSDLPRLRERASAARPALAEFLSWRRAAERHLEQYAQLVAARAATPIVMAAPATTQALTSTA